MQNTGFCLSLTQVFLVRHSLVHGEKQESIHNTLKSYSGGTVEVKLHFIIRIQNVMIHYPLLFLRSTNKSLISSAMSLNQTYCYSLLIFLSLRSVSSEADFLFL